MFADGTFYIASIFGYQVFITRIYATEINSFYTTSLSILNYKEQATYELLFEELKKNLSLHQRFIKVRRITYKVIFQNATPKCTTYSECVSFPKVAFQNMAFKLKFNS
ncbi:hypothetical protein U3516DRAFT_663266 [Neocallimastix sp. 'constans']